MCVCKLNQLRVENIYVQRQYVHVYDCLNNANINHLQSLNCIQFYESPRDYLNRVWGCTYVYENIMQIIPKIWHSWIVD